MRVRARLGTAAALMVCAALSCSYHPSINECTVSCGDGGLCPDGFTCTSNGLCGHSSCGGSDSGVAMDAMDAMDAMTTVTGWVPASTGIDRGDVHSLVIDPAHPATVYAATAGGVWKSIDGAAHWSPSSVGLPRLTIRALAIDPLATTTLYAGTAGAGIWKTSDAGASWTAVNVGPAGLATQSISALAVHPVHNTYVYAGGSIVPAGSGSFAYPVYVSANSGATWSDATGGMVSHSGDTVGFAFGAPPNQDQVYAATFGRGLYFMNYNSTSWTATGSCGNCGGSSLPLTGSGSYLNAIITTSRGMYVAVDATQSLYLTTDGTTWNFVTSSPPSIKALAFGAQTLFMGTPNLVFTSTDGSTYQGIALGGVPATVAVDTQGNAYVGNSGGVYRKTRTATTFSLSNTQLVGHPVRALAVDRQNTGVLYAGLQNGGVYRSSDSAGSWVQLGTGIPTSSVGVTALAIDGVGSSTVFAGTTSSVYLSTDGAGSFTDESVSCAVRALAASPGTGGEIYAACDYFNPGNLGVFLRVGGTPPWMASATGLPAMTAVDALVVSAGDPNSVWAGTRGAGVYHTINGGAMWTVASIGLGMQQVTDLARLEPNQLFATTSDHGLWKSMDGTTWSTATPATVPSALTAVAVAPTQPPTIYVGGLTSGVFRSTDGGATWSDDSLGLGSKAITRIEIDPHDPTQVYAGTWDGGLYRRKP